MANTYSTKLDLDMRLYAEKRDKAKLTQADVIRKAEQEIQKADQQYATDLESIISVFRSIQPEAPAEEGAKEEGAKGEDTK